MIAISGLTKRYRDVLAVDDVTLDVPAGSVTGLLGRNGAGKTTTFRCLLGFAAADAGTIRFDGAPLAPQTFAHIGYVPERPQLYGWMTVKEHLEFAHRTQPAYDAARAAELIAAFRLDPRRKVRRLSKGQQTAVSLCLALAHRPRILILDEPASGLDPVMQRVVLDLIVDASTSGAAILMSSHQIGQIDRAADRIAILRDGRLVLSGDTDDLRARAKVVEATFDDDVPDVAALPGVRRVERMGASVRLYCDNGTEALAATLSARGARGLRVLDRSLEDIFLDAVSDGEPAS
ncbi:MAG TPA: ABC transporter ATP-binding protein [Candidatus Elarobacter sp.]